MAACLVTYYSERKFQKDSGFSMKNRSEPFASLERLARLAKTRNLALAFHYRLRIQGPGPGLVIVGLRTPYPNLPVGSKLHLRGMDLVQLLF